MIDKFEIPCSRDELIFGTLLLFLVAFLVAESRWSRLNDEKAISSSQEVHIYLDTRTSLDSLGMLLDDKNLISNQRELHWAANLLGWRQFQQGHYLVDQDYTYEEFLSKLARGIQDPVSVTIIPGRTKEKIIGSVAKQLQFDSLAFHQAITDSSLLADMELDSEDVIGRLYPNTYSAYWTTSPQAFFRKISREFQKAVVVPHKSRFREIDKTVDEIVTLASIIEWEASNNQEKATISGLYWNRLEKGMRLQADPTVIYAVGEQRRLLYEDYKVEHPYNTYLYRGLPPGPITNPSLSSIKAALYPEEHDYFYMVASPDGSHAFSETFEEHKRKSQKWREWIQEQYRIKRQRERNSE